MAKNRYFQTTKGFNGEIIVAKGVAYTTQTTIENFVNSGADGAIGVFDASTNALIAGTSTIGAPNTPALATATGSGSIAAGTYYYVITALNGAGETVGSGEASITTTTSSSTNTLSWNAVPGATSYRVYRGTATGAQDHYQATASTNFSDTSAVGGSAGTVPVASTAVAASATPNGTTVYIAQKRDGLIHKTTPFTLAAGIVTRTAYSAAAADVWTVSNFPTAAAGQVYSVALFDISSGSQPYQAYDYSYKLNSTDTINSAIDALVLAINSTTDPTNTNFGPLVVASRSSSTLVLTGIVANASPFRVALREDTQYCTLAHTTPFNAGIGTYANVSEIEGEGIIFAGVTTNYPAPINALPLEFGTPTTYASSALGYNLYTFAFYESEKSPLPVERHWQKKYIVLAVPSSGTTPDATVRAIFGV